MTDKVICEECNWRGRLEEIVKVKDPGGEDIWNVCPNCRTPENLISACEYSECWMYASCGTPLSGGGYSQTCGKHVMKETPR